MDIFVIHLPHRKDREEWFTSEFKRVKIEPIIVYGHKTEPGWKGCRDAHLNLMNFADDMFTIFEDDVEFVGAPRDYNRAVAQLPEDWDCLYMGGSPQSPQEKYSPNLFKATDTLTTHAIMWNKRKGGAVEYILEHREEVGKIDVFLKDVIQPKFNCFAMYPQMCVQHEGLGTDTCKRSDVRIMRENAKLYYV